MTIHRVNPIGWFSGDTPTPDQTNKMDINITNGLDRRDGYVDTLNSAITVASGASLTFQAGSLLAAVPSAVYLNGSSGNLAIGSELIGDSTQNDPLRFGFQTIKLSDIGLVLPGTPATRDFAGVPTQRVLDVPQMNKFVMKFTGTLDPLNTAIIFPSIAGYSKLIDVSQIIANKQSLIIGTNEQISAGVGLIIIPKNTGDDRAPLTNDGYIGNRYNKVIVYCDGTNLRFGGKTNANNIVRQQHLHYTGSAGANVFTTTSTSYVDVNDGTNTYSFQFADVQLGDYFDITYNAFLAGVTSTSTANIAIQISTGSGSFVLDNTDLFNNNTVAIQTFKNMIYKSSGAVATTINLVVSSSNTTIKVYSPLTFTVKQRRNLT